MHHSGIPDPHFDPTQIKALAADLALTGPLTVARIATTLGTSSRTLQRYMSKQDGSLRAIIDECRMEIAQVLICQTDFDIQEIAFRIGYGTPSSFARAFSRWAGCSPRQFRKARKCRPQES
ncbi:MAG: AraC family transcriptional regulator [Sedimentitalea sp.]|uniref:helix-turn-helix domain-containing protein n=1 Tax=Sedimentitalea sp. TaxID=2048915 RepID=UPI003267DBFB